VFNSELFHALDWTVVGIYFVIVAAIGIVIGKGQKTTRDYFLGSRNISWWAVGLSIIATETSAATFIGIPAISFGALSMADGKLSVTDGDMSFIQLILGYVIARIILAIIMVPHYFKGEIYSPYQMLTQKFGKSPCTLLL